MTTYNYTSPIIHNSDAAFRAWGRELSNAMQTAGLVKAADTGQINWDTVLKPAYNVGGGVAGYEIFQFNDPLQPTAPVFVKLEYGTGPTQTSAYPGLWLTVGTGTNGAGTLTGVLSTRQLLTHSYGGTACVLPDTANGMPTFVCYKDGYLAVVFKCGGAYCGIPNAVAFFIIGRTGNDDGTENSDGVYVMTRGASSGTGTTNPGGAAGLQYLNFLDSTVVARNINFSVIPGGVTSTKVGTQYQAFKCYAMIPRMRPLLHVATVLTSEYPLGTAFNGKMLGATDRLYMSMGTAAGYAGAADNEGHTLAILWE